MPHPIFVILYIALNIFCFRNLYSAGKDIKKAIRQHKKQWITICVVRIVIILCVLAWINYENFGKL